MMIAIFRRLLKDDSAASAIEYARIAALVSVAAVATLGNFGTSPSTMFSTVSTELDNAVTGVCSGT